MKILFLLKFFYTAMKDTATFYNTIQKQNANSVSVANAHEIENFCLLLTYYNY